MEWTKYLLKRWVLQELLWIGIIVAFGAAMIACHQIFYVWMGHWRFALSPWERFQAISVFGSILATVIILITTSRFAWRVWRTSRRVDYSKVSIARLLDEYELSYLMKPSKWSKGWLDGLTLEVLPRRTLLEVYQGKRLYPPIVTL